MVTISNKSYKAAYSNKKGKNMEKLIEMACEVYQNKQIAKIIKVPEPFMVLKLASDFKRFTGKFIGNAEPDFLGSLGNGRVIAFESKYTSSDRINQNVISDKQYESLDLYHEMNAIVGVVVGIKNVYGFVPWGVFRNMKQIYGRKYMTETELLTYQVPTPGFIDFLNGINIGEVD